MKSSFQIFNFKQAHLIYDFRFAIYAFFEL